MIKVIEGSLLRAPQKIIVHQVNAQGVMGSGVALQLKNKYPQIYDSYKDFISKTPKVSILGKINPVAVKDKIIINMFSQYSYGKDKNTVYTNYGAMGLAFKNVRDYIETINIKEVAMPYNIGCGLANGDWDTVLEIIKSIFVEQSVFLYKI